TRGRGSHPAEPATERAVEGRRFRGASMGRVSMASRHLLPSGSHVHLQKPRGPRLERDVSRAEPAGWSHPYWHRYSRRPMRHATFVCSLWQSLLAPFLKAFTRPGHRRFVEWITAPALNVEEHTVTQSAVVIERTADWKALESFAEYGAWRSDRVTSALLGLIEQ